MISDEPKSELAQDLGDRIQSQNVPLALLVIDDVRFDSDKVMTV